MERADLTARYLIITDDIGINVFIDVETQLRSVLGVEPSGGLVFVLGAAA